MQKLHPPMIRKYRALWTSIIAEWNAAVFFLNDIIIFRINITPRSACAAVRIPTEIFCLVSRQIWEMIVRKFFCLETEKSFLISHKNSMILKTQEACNPRSFTLLTASFNRLSQELHFLPDEVVLLVPPYSEPVPDILHSINIITSHFICNIQTV